MLYVIAAVAIVAIVVIIARVVRPTQDPVDNFRRQIDALSPEARKPTVDQVRDAAEDADEPDADTP